MKTCIILLSFLITLTAAEWKLKTKEESDAIMRSCSQRYNLSDELISKARKEKYPPIEVYQEINCILEGYGVWSSSEGFIADNVMVAFDYYAKRLDMDRTAFRKDLESCLDDNSQGSTPLEWAYRDFKCFIDKKEFFAVLKQVKFYKLDEEEY